jgi:hypothetical protein
MPHSSGDTCDSPADGRPGRLWTLAGRNNSLRLGLVLLAGLAAACRPSVGESPVAMAEADCLAGAGAYLRGHLYGAIETPLDWRGPSLVCEGMPRPEGAGARLRFARRLVPADDYLVIIIGVDGLGADETLSGSPATITVIDERTSRFFSNSGRRCWADVTAQHPVAGSETARAVAGRAYCTAALPAVNGSGSVSLAELEFRGRVDWAADGEMRSP